MVLFTVCFFPFVGCGELSLLLGLSVCWLGVMFGIGFVCLLVGGYVVT